MRRETLCVCLTVALESRMRQKKKKKEKEFSETARPSLLVWVWWSAADSHRPLVPALMMFVQSHLRLTCLSCLWRTLSQKRWPSIPTRLTVLGRYVNDTQVIIKCHQRTVSSYKIHHREGSWQQDHGTQCFYLVWQHHSNYMHKPTYTEH